MSSNISGHIPAKIHCSCRINSGSLKTYIQNPKLQTKLFAGVFNLKPIYLLSALCKVPLILALFNLFLQSQTNYKSTILQLRIGCYLKTTPDHK
jgi:hypothetical protein